MKYKKNIAQKYFPILVETLLQDDESSTEEDEEEISKSIVTVRLIGFPDQKKVENQLKSICIRNIQFTARNPKILLIPDEDDKPRKRKLISKKYSGRIMSWSRFISTQSTCELD